MTTLLERIADMAACVGGNVEEVLVEAANEIERLRAEVQTWKQQSESYWEKIEAMDEAMESLLIRCDDSDSAMYGTLSTSFVRDIVRIARGEQE